MFEFCLAPDTTGDGTGCDNMTAIIVKFHQQRSHPTTGQATKRPAAEISTDSQDNIIPESKKVKSSTEDAEVTANSDNIKEENHVEVENKPNDSVTAESEKQES